MDNSEGHAAGTAWKGLPMIEPDAEFAFLDQVVETFGAAARDMIAEAKSMKDLDTVCYGSLLAGCILHCEKHGIDEGRAVVLNLVNRIFDERQEREKLLPVPTEATLH